MEHDAQLGPNDGLSSLNAKPFEHFVVPSSRQMTLQVHVNEVRRVP